MNEYEIKNADFVRNNGAECTVLLKKDGRFPLSSAGKIALYGSGARNTVKGGTGSGEVNSRYFVNIEDGLRDGGFTITTKAWLDGYDKVKAEAKQAFVKQVRAEAKAMHTQTLAICMGKTPSEPEYSLPLNGEGETAVYVLSRISGEGSDRPAVPGEILLTQTEKRDILACNEAYPNFMLVINAGGVVDLSEVKDVKNILVLSQLGSETGHILSDILLGKSNPSGKLATTWTAWKDYQTIGTFGDLNETRYKEGIYVGYRYFDTMGIRPLFPFGHGLSYTDFSIMQSTPLLEGEQASVVAQVKNTGAYTGKEVLQLYVTKPQQKLDQPRQSLAAFSKTEEVQPGSTASVRLTFAMSEIASYDEETASYILEAGDYVLRIGNSSADTVACGLIRVKEEICVRQVRSCFAKPDFLDFRPNRKDEVLPEVPVLELDASSIKTERVSYDFPEEVDTDIEKLSDEELVRMNMGTFDPKGGVSGIVGNAGITVAGAAGQTSLEVKKYGIPSLVMADGGSGLRLAREYAIDKNGGVHTLGINFPESLLDFMPKLTRFFVMRMGYHPKKSDTIRYQYATALPIGTAIAQSFNVDFAEACGDIVGEEMTLFGVHLWLAPSQNVHRDIRCGRNFEYYSEDPLVSGLIAAAVTKGVQAHVGCGTTIKHFACNNQELNRNQNNSQVSERALREIYLRSFEITVREAQPKAIMTSYNLINGVHTSEDRRLIMDVLRCEFGYQGITMTDWTIKGYAGAKDSIYPVATAPNTIMAGNDLFMPGSRDDFAEVMEAFKSRKVTRKQLERNATRISRMAKQLSNT